MSTIVLLLIGYVTFGQNVSHPMILTHIKTPEPVNIVIAAILLHALTTLRYCAVSVFHRNLACQCPFPF